MIEEGVDADVVTRAHRGDVDAMGEVEEACRGAGLRTRWHTRQARADQPSVVEHTLRVWVWVDDQTTAIFKAVVAEEQRVATQE